VNKRNLIIQAAVAGLFSAATLSAYATGVGSANGNSAQIATQAVTASSVIGAGSIQFVETGSLPPGTYEVYVKLNGGATFAETAGGNINAGTLSINGVSSGTTATAAVSAGVVSADQTFVVFPIVITAPAGLPANTTTFTFQPSGVAASAGGIANAFSAASTGSLTATVSIGASASYSTTAPVADEATASTAPIATFVSGITDGALSSGLFTGAGLPLPYTTAVNPEAAVINVVGGATGVQLTGNVNVAGNSVLLDLGGFYFADVNSTHTTGGTTAPYGADAAHSFNIATDYTAATSTAVVTAPAGFFSVANGTGGSVFLSASATCGAVLAGSTAAAISATGATATFSAIPAFTQDVPVYVCVQATTADTTAWVQGTPSVTATMVSQLTTVASVTLASTNLYTLNSNGGTAYVREYVPAAATASTGYQSFIRVINTGSVPAKISFAFIDDAQGTALTSAAGTTTAAVPKGGAITLTSAQIEALVVAANGTAPTASARPRVFVTAPTTITVQSYLFNGAANVFTEVSGGTNGSAGTGNGVTTSTGQ
jgi:hypothetical protein